MNVNSETGQVGFVSTGNNEISLDYYKVIVRDVSGQEVFNKIYSNTTTSTNVAEVTQQSICSPYTVSVQAHNSFGYSESNYIISSSTEGMYLVYYCIYTFNPFTYNRSMYVHKT